MEANPEDRLRKGLERQAQLKENLRTQAELGINVPTSRAEAKKRGSQFYFTGKPCKNGHVAKRWANGGCYDCVAISRLANMKKKWAKDPEEMKARCNAYYARNRETRIAAVKAYAETNREKIAIKNQQYQKDHPEIHRANGAKRRARKNNATPPWLTPEMNAEIKDMYAEASRLKCSQGYSLHIDHIVPLKGDTVCGLHVPWNLRLATRLENFRKNRLFKDQFIGRAVPIPLGCGAGLGSYQLL